MAEPTCPPLVLHSSRATSTPWLRFWKHANVHSVRRTKQTTLLRLLHPHRNESAYIFRNRHRFFGRDPNVDNDVPAVRKLRIEVVTIPWSVLTTLLVILLINLWRA